MTSLASPPPPALTWRLSAPEAEPVPADGEPITPDWAFGDATGRGVRVCVVDSGVELDHPLVGRVDGSWAVVSDDDGIRVEPDEEGDACGHGTACAGIIRRTAPDCELYSVRVLSPRGKGSGPTMMAGLRWAIEQGFDVINLSLSTTQHKFSADLHALADEAFFRRTAIVASAHNTPVESFPWRFASVISVGSHARPDPELYLYNPAPPVEFFAPGQNVTVAWKGGKTIRSTGNSFATPFIAGLCARILEKHARMTTFQLKNALYLSAANVRTGDGGAA